MSSNESNQDFHINNLVSEKPKDSSLNYDVLTARSSAQTSSPKQEIPEVASSNNPKMVGVIPAPSKLREEKTDDPEVVSSNKNDLVSVLLSLSKLREFARSIGAKHGGQHPFDGLNVADEHQKKYMKPTNIKTHRKRRPKALSEEELQEATLDYLSGMRLIDIAKRYGFSRWFLTKQFCEAKVPIRRQSMTIEQVRVAESLYASGLSLERVGEITGLPKSTIRRAFVRNGIGRRGV